MKPYELAEAYAQNGLGMDALGKGVAEMWRDSLVEKVYCTYPREGA